jgi:hypothetical protein
MAERKKIKPYRNGRTLKEYQSRYGEIRGHELWKIRNDRQSYRFSKDYYIDKYGSELGETYYSEYILSMDKTSLKSFTDRYGLNKGTERYNSFIECLRYNNSEEYFIEKYGIDDGIKRRLDLIQKRIISFPGYSKISQVLFWGIYEKLNDDLKNITYFSELNTEFTFFINKPWCKLMCVDFKCGKKIIEFDGDYWHSGIEQKNKDVLRDEYLINTGYSVLRINECDFNANNVGVISKCLTFLME